MRSVFTISNTHENIFDNVEKKSAYSTNYIFYIHMNWQYLHNNEHALDCMYLDSN